MQDSTIERKERDSHRGIFVIIGSVFTGLRLLIGLTLLIVALAPPLMNKQMPDPSKIARKSKAVTAETVDTPADGEFVSITGALTSDETAGDPLFNVNGAYVFLHRKVEMYSWNETETLSYSGEYSTSSDGKTKYVEDISDFYIGKAYRLGWSAESLEIYSTGRPEQYVNPSASIQSERFTAGEARLDRSGLGGYRVDLEALHFSSASPLKIDRKTFTPAHGARVKGAHKIFVGKGSLLEPKLGDLRIEYDAVESGATVTLFGKLNGDAIEPYVHDGDVRFHHAFAGSRKDALDRMQAEHWANVWIEWALRAAPIFEHVDLDAFFRTPSAEARRKLVEEIAESRDFILWATWAFRGIGLFILWIGLCLFVGPIKRAVDSALVMDTTRRSRLILPMLAVAIILSAILWLR